MKIRVASSDVERERKGDCEERKTFSWTGTQTRFKFYLLAFILEKLNIFMKIKYLYIQSNMEANLVFVNKY